MNLKLAMKATSSLAAAGVLIASSMAYADELRIVSWGGAADDIPILIVLGQACQGSCSKRLSFEATLTQDPDQSLDSPFCTDDIVVLDVPC